MTGTGTTAPLWRKVPEDRRYWLYKTIEYMALRGFHAETISNVCGITVGELYTALGKLQIRLRDYRNGKGEVAEKLVGSAKRQLHGGPVHREVAFRKVKGKATRRRVRTA